MLAALLQELGDDDLRLAGLRHAQLSDATIWKRKRKAIKKRLCFQIVVSL